MTFDPCPHQKTQIILSAGKYIRKLKGLPEENNITVLYEETCHLLDIPVAFLDSSIANKLPSPGEMKDVNRNFIVPRKDCPACGRSMVLSPICQSCKDAEGGKYKSGYKCEACGFMDEKSEKFFTRRLVDMGVEIPTGTKASWGIKTATDEGLK